MSDVELTPADFGLAPDDAASAPTPETDENVDLFIELVASETSIDQSIAPATGLEDDASGSSVGETIPVAEQDIDVVVDFGAADEIDLIDSAADEAALTEFLEVTEEIFETGPPSGAPAADVSTRSAALESHFESVSQIVAPLAHSMLGGAQDVGFDGLQTAIENILQDPDVEIFQDGSTLRSELHEVVQETLDAHSITDESVKWSILDGIDDILGHEVVEVVEDVIEEVIEDIVEDVLGVSDGVGDPEGTDATIVFFSEEAKEKFVEALADFIKKLFTNNDEIDLVSFIEALTEVMHYSTGPVDFSEESEVIADLRKTAQRAFDPNPNGVDASDTTA
ncbi:MAG: hypothetical protein AAGM38_01745 [Pseudomonadota bacterium]